MRVCFLIVLCVLLGCTQRAEEAVAVDTSARALGLDECAACGMVVREQPAPRGQAVHRDGARVWFCSLGDMLVYVQSPSSHGRVVACYVEDMGTQVDVSLLETGAKPWIRAEEAHFVTGLARPGVMGEPVLAYARPEQAAQVAQTHNGRQQNWPTLSGNEP